MSQDRYAPWERQLAAAADGWECFDAWATWVGERSTYDPLGSLDALQQVDLYCLFYAVAERVPLKIGEPAPLPDCAAGLALAVLRGDGVAARALVDRLLETWLAEDTPCETR